MKATLGWVLVAVTMAVTVPPMAQAQVNVPAESEVATAVAPEPELATTVAPTNDAGSPGAQGCAETVTVTFCNYSGCGLTLTQEEANTGE